MLIFSKFLLIPLLEFLKSLFYPNSVLWKSKLKKKKMKEEKVRLLDELSTP